MKRQSVHLFVAAVLALLGPLAQNGRCNFILSDNEQFTVNSVQSIGILYDTSRASIVSGGYVNQLYAYDSSTVNISVGGYVNNFLSARNSSTVNISGGAVGGFFSVYDSSAVNISGEGEAVWLGAYDSSAVNISSDGHVVWLGAYNSSAVNMTGENIGSLNTYDSSIVNISSGSVNQLWAYNYSTVTLYGQNFRVVSSGGIVFDGNRVLGTGILSGNWMDGTPWSMDILINEPTATILAIHEPAVIPAPGALVLGGIGVSVVTWLRRRRML